MTEQEWLAGTDPERMLEFVKGKTSRRKLRLFACACVRRIEHLLRDERSKKAVEVAEQYADGRVTEIELNIAWTAAREAKNAAEGWIPRWAGGTGKSGKMAAMGAYAITYLGDDAQEYVSLAALDARRAQHSEEVEGNAQSHLLREIVGNPFRPASPAPFWCTSIVQSLAHGVYEERAFDCLPVLGDALEEAGCDNADILNHLRGPGPHVRGCWVVDLVLGKQ